MPQETLPCPLCGSDRSSLFNQDHFLNTLVINRLCSECGLVYQSPRMSEREAAEFHSRQYRLQAASGKAVWIPPVGPRPEACRSRLPRNRQCDPAS